MYRCEKRYDSVLSPMAAMELCIESYSRAMPRSILGSDVKISLHDNSTTTAQHSTRAQIKTNESYTPQ
jgi:hypothetical protein